MAVVRDLDFTSSLPAGVTFSRAGSRSALQSGVFATVASNVPAFESGSSGALGLSIQAASSNIFTSDAYGTSNPWWRDDATATSGIANSLTGANDAWQFAEAAGASNVYQQLYNTPGGLLDGDRFCFSGYFRQSATSERSLFELAQTVVYNNSGACAVFRNDGVHGVSYRQDFSSPSVFNQTVVGYESIDDEWQRIWISSVKQPATQPPSFMLRSVDWDLRLANTSPNVLHRIDFYGLQLENGVRSPSSLLGPSGSVAEDVLTITDITGFNSAQGTIIVEYDAYDGALLSQSGTPLLGASKPGKNGIAWSGSTSTTCANAAEAVAGGAFAVTGALRILQGTRGRIRRITVHDVRMSESELRAATVRESSHAPGAWRIATTHNRLPSKIYTPLAGFNQIARYPFKITHGCSQIRLSFNNYISSTTGDIDGAAFSIVKCGIEVAGVTTPVLFGGNAGATVPLGAEDFLSDAVGPLAAGTEGFIRVESSGVNFPASRWSSENGASAWCYNTANTVASDVYSTGPIVLISGTGQEFFPHGLCPVVIGLPSSATNDPDAMFIVGDSLVEGTGNLNFEGTYFQKAAATTNKPLLMHAVGGESHIDRDESRKWHSMLKYCRALFDDLFANQASAVLGLSLSVYQAARDNNIHWIGRVESLPSTGSNDNWASNQGPIYPKPTVGDLNNEQWLASGFIDSILFGDGVINRSNGGWVTNGTPFLMTTDGLHTTQTADNILAATAADIFDSIIVSQPAVALPESVPVDLGLIEFGAIGATVTAGQAPVAVSLGLAGIEFAGAQAAVIVSSDPVSFSVDLGGVEITPRRASIFAGSSGNLITTYRANWL